MFHLRLFFACVAFCFSTNSLCAAEPKSTVETKNSKIVTITHQETGMNFRFPKDNFRRDRETGCTWVAELDESHYNVEFARLPKVLNDAEQLQWLKKTGDQSKDKREDKTIKMGSLHAREYLFVNELGTTKIRLVVSPKWTFTFMLHCDKDGPQKTQARKDFFNSIQQRSSK